MENKKRALISVTDKTGVVELAKCLIENGIEIISTGGTAKHLRESGIAVVDVSEVTGFPECLDGRIKTINPLIEGGMLAIRANENHMEQVKELEIPLIDYVICNLYPFEKTISKEGVSEAEAIEQIDIGGPTMIRAAAKNFQDVVVLTDIADYPKIIDELTNNGEVTLETKKALRNKVFELMSHYDGTIYEYLTKEELQNLSIPLKYGCNPYQGNAKIYVNKGAMPLKVLNGKPGYINYLDALNGWQLVRELEKATGMPAATSFKHVSPAGAAVGLPLTEELKKAYFAENMDLSPLATAYVRARGADRKSSFGDFVALSSNVDETVARFLTNEVSDGIIAPSYDEAALEILRKKKKGNYPVIQIDRDYLPPKTEKKEVFGITFEQERNEIVIDDQLLNNIVTANKNLPTEAIRDLIISLITLKYTQSNSICFAKEGQAIGVGAGQQSRIDCVRLAGNKAQNWWLRQHPYFLNLPFKETVKRADMNNIIDLMLEDSNWYLKIDINRYFKFNPGILSAEEINEWLNKLDEVSLGSDAFFPFADNIEAAKEYGVKYIAQPGGSINDDQVIEKCNEYDMVLANNTPRLFHH